MNAYILGLFIALGSLGLFFILKSTIRPIVQALLIGPLNNYFLDYLRLSTKSQFDSAYATDNVDRAWNELLFAKVYEIGAARVSYAKRDQNLSYIRAASKPSRRLADELIKVLPRQGGNLEFQTKLTCYICEILKNLEPFNENDKYQIVKSTNKAVIENFSTAISAWIAGGFYFVFSLMYIVGDFPPLALLLSTLILYILMVVPLFRLRLRNLMIAALMTAIASVVILGLGSFATFRQGEAQYLQDIDLNLYQNPGSKLSIVYPAYIALDDVGCSSRKVSVLVNGSLSTPIRFYLDHDQFLVLDKKCRRIVPQIESAQPETQVYEFYISARDNSPFFSKTQQSLRIIPQYVSTSGVVDFNLNDTFTIQIEYWFWNLLRNTYVQLCFIGFAIFLFVINFLTAKVQ